MICKLRTKAKYSSAENLAGFLDELAANKNEITTLDLSMNTFLPEAATSIAARIRGLANLKRVRLESIFDSLNVEQRNAVLTAFLDALPLTLEELEMPSNALSCEYPDVLGDFLSACPLRVLSLYDCGLGEDGLARLTVDLSRLKNKANLATLNLGKNRINFIHEEFVSLFNEFENLTDFRIRSNTIDEEGLAHFLENATVSKLTVLDISDNFVCGDCHRALGMLFQRAALEQLYLYDAKMDDGGLAEFLGLALEKTHDELPGGIEDRKPELVLDISCLAAGQECVPLLERLASKYAVKRLVLFENDFDDLERLTSLVSAEGGVVIAEEDQLVETPAIDQSIIERIKNI